MTRMQASGQSSAGWGETCGKAVAPAQILGQIRRNIMMCVLGNCMVLQSLKVKTGILRARLFGFPCDPSAAAHKL